MSHLILFKPLRVNCGFVFIDDAKSYLEALENVLSRYPMWCRYFDQTAKLDPILENNELLLAKEEEALRQISVAQNHDVEANATTLALEYFASPWRKEIVGVLIADFDMPVETGDLFCERHAATGLQRILLTGKADEAQAIRAFNLKRIDHFLGKNEQVKANPQGSPMIDAQGKPITLLTILRNELDRHRELSAETRGKPLWAVLDPTTKAVLQTRVAADALTQLLQEYRIREYMMLGLPLGILGLSSDQKAYWVQIETAESKQGQLEVLEEYAWSDDVVARVTRGESVLNFSVMDDLNLDTTEVPLRVLSATPYLAVAVTLLDKLPPKLQPVF